MGRVLGAVVLGIVTLVSCAVLVAVVLGTGSAGSVPPASTASAAGGAPASGGSRARTAIPTAWVTLYEEAATTCPGLSWSLLGAVGTVESDSGQSTAPGVWSGTNSAGAEGPFQFEPATFAAYATAGPGGARPPTPYDPVDAVYSASRLLCADGAGNPSTLRGAVASYNHSETYVNTVLTLAIALGEDPGLSGTIATALSFAAAQLGTPYLWGGTGSGGFDCSGLTQAAYRQAGIVLPRVAQGQFDAGPVLAGGATVEPGDLIYFGTGPSAVDHVGLYVGAGEMIDAPHTGALVRYDDADWSGLVGATRPG